MERLILLARKSLTLFAERLERCAKNDLSVPLDLSFFIVYFLDPIIDLTFSLSFFVKLQHF